MRTTVGIVGAGPAGLTLALLLQRRGIGCVVLERRSRDYVEHRVRAGLLEHNTVELLHDLGVDARLRSESLRHDGIYLRRQGMTQHIPITELTGRHVTIYGQQEVVKDLIAACLERDIEIRFEVEDVVLGDLLSEGPRIGYHRDGQPDELGCAFVAGCDGFHGVCRASIPDGFLTEYQLEYPFGWLGILAHAAPATGELIYAWHEHGFALYSMRSSTVSRLYLQVPTNESLDNWPDERIWEELQARLGTEVWRV